MNANTKNMILGGVIVLVGGFAIYRLVGSSPKPDFPSEYTIQGVCLLCKAETPLTQRIRERPPFECSKCDGNSVFPWHYCPNCRKRFVPPPEKGGDGVLRLPIVPTCPGCKGANATGFDPNDPEQKPEGDFPLPALPK